MSNDMLEEDFVFKQPELADLVDIKVLTDLQKERQALAVQVDLYDHKIEIVRLKLKIKYNLSDTDTIDSQSGTITRIK